MADRYWVGGAGTWDATTTTNWSATSGGGGGASAPTSADNVIFNSSSNATAYAVTVGTNAVCADVTIAGPLVGNVTITSGATAVINVYGSWTSAATGVVFTTTAGATINFLATTTGKTITTNNVTLGAMSIYLSDVGGGWTLGSAFTNTQNFTITAGTFSTANFPMTIGFLAATTTATRSISLGSSTITGTAATFVNIANASNLTFNAGTSTIIGNSASTTFNGGGLTYSTVNFTGTGTGTTTIIGANTFTTLTQSAVAAAGLRFVSIGANQTIGTLTLSNGGAANRRTFVRSDVTGTQRTLTVATLTALVDVDFRDIIAAGASGAWTGTRLGNCRNNTNISFSTPTTKYWSTVAGVSASWGGSASWASSSGGTPGVNDFPLAQDTAIIDNSGATTGNGLRTGNTITIDANWNIGTIDCSGRTTAFNWTQGNSDPVLYGDVTLTSSMTMTTVTGTPTWTFAANGRLCQLNTAGVILRLSSLTVDGNCALGLYSNVQAELVAGTTGGVTVNLGELRLNNYALTTVAFVAGAFTNTLDFGASGTIVLTGTGTIFTGSTTTTVAGTPQVICTDSGATARTITPGVVTQANSISFRITSGTGSMVFTAGSVRDIDFTDGTNPTGFAGNVTNTAITIYGNFKASTSGMTRTPGTQAYTFAATSSTQTINTAGVTFDCPFTFNGAASVFILQSALTLGSTRALTLTAGDLYLLGNTITTGTFSCSNSNYRSLINGNVPIIITGNNATVVNFGTTTNFFADVPPTFDLNYSGSVGTRTIAYGALSYTTTVAPNITVSAGSDTITTSGTTTLGNLVFTSGFTGTLNNATRNIYGNLTLVAGMATPQSGALVNTFSGVGSQTITTAGKTLDFPITFDGVGGTWQLQDALTSGATRIATLNAGTLDLASYTLTTGIFSSSNSNTRTLAFGTGKIVITGNNTTVFSTNTGTNLTVTGSKRVEYNYSGSTGLRQISGPLTATAIEGVNLCDHYITAGTDTFNPNGARWYGTIDCTGFGGTFSSSSLPIYGNFVLSSVSTFVASAGVIFSATSGTKTITSNGKTIDGTVTFNGIGGTWSLQDALTISSANTLTLTNGTVQSVYAITTGLFSSNNTNTRSFTTTNQLSLTGSGTFFDANATGFTFNAANITTSGTSAKTFAGGGYTNYPPLINTGVGTLTISGSNTFTSIINTVASTFLFTAGTTQTAGAFSLNNTTINSTTSGTQAFLVLNALTNNVNVANSNIKDSNASPVGYWFAPLVNGNTNSGNNTGWDFSTKPLQSDFLIFLI